MSMSYFPRPIDVKNVVKYIMHFVYIFDMSLYQYN